MVLKKKPPSTQYTVLYGRHKEGDCDGGAERQRRRVRRGGVVVKREKGVNCVFESQRAAEVIYITTVMKHP